MSRRQSVLAPASRTDHGSKFALIVGDKIYALETTDKAALATLDEQAGKTATVSGSLDGGAIQVSSVVAK